MHVWFSFFIVAFPSAFVYLFIGSNTHQIKKKNDKDVLIFSPDYSAKTKAHSNIADINVTVCLDFSIICWWMRVELATNFIVDIVSILLEL